MFVEIHKNISEELELLIKSMGLSYEISDCTLDDAHRIGGNNKYAKKQN